MPSNHRIFHSSWIKREQRIEWNDVLTRQKKGNETNPFNKYFLIKWTAIELFSIVKYDRHFTNICYMQWNNTVRAKSIWYLLYLNISRECRKTRNRLNLIGFRFERNFLLVHFCCQLNNEISAISNEVLFIRTVEISNNKQSREEFKCGKCFIHLKMEWIEIVSSFVYWKYFVVRMQSNDDGYKWKAEISLTSLFVHLKSGTPIIWARNNIFNGLIVISSCVILMCTYNFDIVLLFKSGDIRVVVLFISVWSPYCVVRFHWRHDEKI